MMPCAACSERMPVHLPATCVGAEHGRRAAPRLRGWQAHGHALASEHRRGARHIKYSASKLNLREVTAAHAHTTAVHVRSTSMKAGVPNGSATFYRGCDLESYTLERDSCTHAHATCRSAAVYMPCGLKERARVGWLPRAYAAPPLSGSRGGCAQQEAHSSVWGSC
jgi:hypothetical protein